MNDKQNEEKSKDKKLLRFEDYFHCPKCGAKNGAPNECEFQFECAGCGKKFRRLAFVN